MGIQAPRGAYWHYLLSSGGNAGIGKETARAFAAAGARVIITCRTEEKGKASAAEIAKTGVKVEPYHQAALLLSVVQGPLVLAAVLYHAAAGTTACPRSMLELCVLLTTPRHKRMHALM